MKKVYGFTLVELIVVISVIAILAGMVTPLVSSLTEEARKTRMTADVYALKQSVVSFESIYKEFPGYQINAPGAGTATIPAAPTGYPAVTAITGGTRYTTVDTTTDTHITNLNNALRPFMSKSINKDPWNTNYKYYLNLNAATGKVGYVASAGPNKAITVTSTIAYNGTVSNDDYYDCFYKK